MRGIDVAGALALALLFFPLAGLAALAIRLIDGGPVLFVQRRVGRGGVRFGMVKFRTMAAGRTTRLGRLLRRSSVDELPQLWNVLRGDMALVGPRPLAPCDLPAGRPLAGRHSLRPGLTGLVQIGGRNGLPWDARFARDAWYVAHRSVWLDLAILAATLPAVLAQSLGDAACGHRLRRRRVTGPIARWTGGLAPAILRRLSPKEVPMRPLPFAALTLVALGACTPGSGTVSYAFRPATTVAEKDQDSFQCEVAAASAVPADTRIGTTPTYQGAPRSVCTDEGDCVVVPGERYGGRPYSYDGNADLRAEFFDRCLAERGYSVTRLPRCDAAIVPDGATEALDGRLLPPRPDACAVNITTRASNLLYGATPN